MLDYVNPAPYIFKGKYDFEFQKNKQKIVDNLKIAKDITTQYNVPQPLMRDGAETSVVLMGTQYHPPHTWTEFRDFVQGWLPARIGEIWETWRLEPRVKNYISESWVNVHPKGGWTAEHMHNRAIVAVSCYLNVPPKGGNLLIENPMQIYKCAEPMHGNYDSLGLKWHTVDVETNDVLLFPGWLKHKTETNHSDEDRYIMSINIMYDFDQRVSKMV